MKQLDYVLWKRQVLQKICQKTQVPKCYTKKNQEHKLCFFYSDYKKELTWFHTCFYEKSERTGRYVKHVPQNLSSLLQDIPGLAVFYLDDGTLRTDTNSYRIATQSFNKEENEIIQQVLKENFALESSVEAWKNKKGELKYGLAILARNNMSIKFRDLLYDFVESEVPSMLYKIVRPRND